MLHSAPGSSEKEGHRPFGMRPEEGHQDDQGVEQVSSEDRLRKWV